MFTFFFYFDVKNSLLQFVQASYIIPCTITNILPVLLNGQRSWTIFCL